MTGTICKNHWCWETSISLTDFKHQLSEQLTDHCSYTQPIVNSPYNYLPHPHIVFIYLHTSISNCTSSSAQLVIILLLWPIYCLASLLHLHTLYIDCSIVLLTVLLFIPCVTVCVALLCFILARSQL
jgi:hypothetical protein